MASDIETAVLRAARRKFGKCRHCPSGYVEFGVDEYRRATGICVNCGRENIQRVMPAAEVEAQCGVNGGRRG